MKVKELIELLEELPEDYDVVVSADAEGNEFSPLSEVSTAMYMAEQPWFGYLVDPEQEDSYLENSIVLWRV